MDNTINLKVRALMDMVYLSRVVFDQLKDLLEKIDPVDGEYTKDKLLVKFTEVYNVINEISNNSIITQINAKLNGVYSALNVYDTEYASHLTKIDSYIRFMYNFLKTNYEGIRTASESSHIQTNASVIHYRLNSIINTIVDILPSVTVQMRAPSISLLHNFIGKDGYYNVYVESDQVVIHNINTTPVFKYVTTSSLGMSGSFVKSGTRIVYIDNNFIYISAIRTLNSGDKIPVILKVSKINLDVSLLNINLVPFINKEIVYVNPTGSKIIYLDTLHLSMVKQDGTISQILLRNTFDNIQFSYYNGYFYLHACKNNLITTMKIFDDVMNTIHMDSRTLPTTFRSIQFYQYKILLVDVDNVLTIGSFILGATSKLSLTLKKTNIVMIGEVILHGDNIYNNDDNSFGIEIVEDKIVKNIIDSKSHTTPSNFNSWKRLDVVGNDIGYGIEFEIVMKPDLSLETIEYRKLSDRGATLDIVLFRNGTSIMTIDTFNKTIYNIVSQDTDIPEIEFIDGVNTKFRLKNSSACKIYIKENGSIGLTTIDDITYKILSHSEVYGD